MSKKVLFLGNDAEGKLLPPESQIGDGSPIPSISRGFSAFEDQSQPGSQIRLLIPKVHNAPERAPLSSESAIKSNASGSFGAVISKHTGKHLNPSRGSSKYLLEGDFLKKPSLIKENSRQSLKVMENEDPEGFSSKIRRRSKHGQETIKSNISKQTSRTNLNPSSRTIEESYSKSNSDMYAIQSAYYDMIGASDQTRHMSRIENHYFNALMSKLTRRPSPREKSPEEFDNQVKAINENIQTPDSEKLAYLDIGEKDDLERVRDYTDKLPMLRARKTILKFMKYISLICYKIIIHPIFDNFILLIIVINSLILAFDDPTNDVSSLPEWVDTAFLVIYTMEMILKIVGLGFVMGKHSYLRDYWNIMDFIIVVTAYIPKVVSSESVDLRSLRSLRIARPLRTISNVESLRVLILTLVAAFGPLLNTLFVLLFLFMVFAIGGLQLFSGLLKKRCMEVATGKPVYSSFLASSNNQLYCSMDSDCLNSNPDFICAKMVWNPYHGTMSFDNIGSAFLMVFQIMTLEGWSDIMIALQKTFSPLVAIYFVFLIFMGTFFLLNMALAVLKTEFTANKEKNKEGGKKKKFRKPKSHDERQIQKIRENKVQILELIRKHRANLLPSKKYQFKKDKLTPIIKSNKKTSIWKKLYSWLESLFKLCRRKSKENKKSTATVVPLMNSEEATFNPQPGDTVGGPENNPSSLINPTEMALSSSSRNLLPITPNLGNNVRITLDKSSMSSESLPVQSNLKPPEETPNEDKNNLNKRQDVITPRNAGGISIKISQPIQEFSKNPEFIHSLSHDPFASRIIEEDESPRPDESPRTIPSSVLSRGSRANIVYIKREHQQAQDPVRPSTSYKQRLGETTLETGRRKSVQIIGNAGIRKKKITLFSDDNPHARSPSPRRKDSIDSINKSFSKRFNKGKSIIEEVDEDMSFYEFMKDQVASPEVKKKEDMNAIIRKKINNLGKLQTQQKPRLSQLLRQMSAIDIDHDEELRSIRYNGTIAIIDDSDIFENKSKRHHPHRVRGSGKKTSNSKVGRKTVKRKTKKIKEQQAEGAVESNKPSEFPTDILEILNEDNEPPITIDLRIMKPEPIFVYHESTSTDDILPSLKEKIKKDKELQEFNRIRNTKLPIKYPITIKDQAAAEKRKSTYNSEFTSKTSLAVKKSYRAITLRERNKELEGLENETIRSNTIREQGTELRRSMSRLSARNTIRRLAHTGNRRPDRWGVANLVEEDDLNEDQLKDMNAVLERLDQPFENEVKWEDPSFVEAKMKEEKFLMEEEWFKIRRDDLNKEKISTSAWSGTNVLGLSSQDFPIDRTKLAINNQDYDIWRPGVIGVIHALRRKTKKLTCSGTFNALIILSVLFNTIILASEGLVSSTGIKDLFSSLNFAFTIIFTVEMGLKLFGLGPKTYLKDNMNLFDAAIVTISLAELIFFSGGQSAISALRAVRLFRTFRVMRVAKLLRSLQFMRVIVGVISRSIQDFMYIAILLFLFIFIYALLGMQLFGGKFNFPDNVGDGKIRQNFDSFIAAFMTVFQVMTQENWNSIMQLALRSSAGTFLSALYFISWIFIGNYVFLNLFLAILLDQFDDPRVLEDLKEEVFDDDEEEEDEILRQSTTLVPVGPAAAIREGSGTYNKKMTSYTKYKTLRTLSNHSNENSTRNRDITRLRSSNTMRSGSDLYDDFDEPYHRGPQPFKDVYCEKAFYFLGKENLIRRFCFHIVKHNKFEKVILYAIAASSLKLCIDSYFKDSDSAVSKYLNILDYFFNIFFIIECALKCTYYGFIMEKNTYMRDSWNILDFFIVCASILDMSLGSGINLGFIKILRLLRTLRPLRFISHNLNMKLIVTALLESVGAIFNVLIVVLMIWLMFAILATNIVGSKMGYCKFDPDVAAPSSKYGISKTECDKYGTWTVPNINFDNVFSGMLSLFVLSTLEGWPDIMMTVLDANDASEGPKESGNAVFTYIFFIVFIFVGSYFLLNLFVGVIFLRFTQARENEERRVRFLTDEQKKWVQIQQLLVLEKPDDSKVEPKRNFQKKIFRLISHPGFEIFIIVCIILNIVTMGMAYEGMSTTYENVLKYINYFFSAIFFIEAVLKHIGLGVFRYWRSGWDRFDAFVVLASIVDILMDFLQKDLTKALRVGPQLARVMRVLRVTRLLKLVRSLENLQEIINVLILSFPKLLNVGSLLFLVYFIYSVLGVFIFSDIRSGTVIDNTTKFNSFHSALITLFRASTGENWYLIMFDTMYPGECEGGGDSCAQPIAGPFFWITFVIIVQYIMLNLFILVVLEEVENNLLSQDNPVKEFRQLYEDYYKKVWEKFTVQWGCTKIHEKQLMPFFKSLPYPLGWLNSEETSNKMIAKAITQMNLITDPDGFLFFSDVLFATFKRVYGGEKIMIDGILPEAVVKEEERTRKKIEKIKKNVNIKTSTRESVNPIFRMLFAGMTIRAWMKYAERKWKLIEDNPNGEYVSESDEDDYEYIDMDEEVDDEDEEDEEAEIEDDDDDDSNDEELNQNVRNSLEADEIDEVAEDNERSQILQTSQKTQDAMGGIIKRRENKEGTKITIISAPPNRNELDLDASPTGFMKRYSTNNLIGFLDPDGEYQSSSKKSSKSKLEEDEKSGINYNINNNIIINNNFYINYPETNLSKQASFELDRKVSEIKLKSSKSNPTSYNDALEVPSGELSSRSIIKGQGNEKEVI